jgi:hypothetical protein
MIITSKHFIIGAIILILALKVIFNNDAEEDTAKTAAPPAVEVIDWSLQKERESTATQRRISRLEELEERQKERSVAAKDLSFYRQLILNSRHAEWTVILEKYWAEYEQLLEIAKQSHAGVTDCTICIFVFSARNHPMEYAQPVSVTAYDSGMNSAQPVEAMESASWAPAGNYIE